MVVAHIASIESAAELREHLRLRDFVITDKTLLVFDIDETVFVANNPKARSVWFGAMLAEQLQVKSNFVDAINETRRLYRAAQDQTTFEPVDPELIVFFNEARKAGARLIGLTSRSRELCDITPQQLTSVGLVGFDVPSKYYELHLPPHEFPLIFDHNIFFTSGAHKGLCLGRLLREFDWRPDQIIFIDDSYHHVVGVESYANMEGIPSHAFHFTAYQKTMAAVEDRLIKR